MKQYYIYKITFLCGRVKNRYYIGKHSTSNSNDNYTGSGRFCNYYFKKYGKIENVTYVKEILEYNPDEATNSKREAEIIGDLWCTDKLCKNQKPGGIGGWMNDRPSPMKGKVYDEAFRLKCSISHKNSEKFQEVMKSEEYRKKMSERMSGKNNSFYGKHHSEETRKKLSAARMGKEPWNKGKKASRTVDRTS